MNNPNSFDEGVEDANIANPNTNSQGTEPVTTDYKTKFTFSSQEAIRLKADNDRKDAIILQLEANQSSDFINPTPTDEMFSGFNDLDDEAKTNLLAYTDTIEKRVRDKIYTDPALVFARSNYNEKKFDDALNALLPKYPDIQASADEFKTKYFNPNNVPDNIADILEDVAKIYLFDQAKEIGASEERSKADRIEHDAGTGGEKTPSARRSMEDWVHMSQTNPAKFAASQKDYDADSKHF